MNALERAELRIKMGAPGFALMGERTLARLLRAITDAPPLDPDEIESLTVVPVTRLLSKREEQLLVALSHGLENAQIAELYGISIDTVKTHLRRMQFKLRAKNRTHLVGCGFRAGILS